MYKRSKCTKVTIVHRIGAASTAAEAGIDEATIKAMGRWRSDAYQTYVRVPQERMCSISKTLAKQ